MNNIRDYIDTKTVYKDKIFNEFEDLIICSICGNILIEPMICNNCQTVICKECQEEWGRKSNECPNRCKNPKYQKCLDISNLLSKLKFFCPICEEAINYDNIKEHSLIKCQRKNNIEKLTE